MAMVNLSVGLTLASRAERQTDLHTMRKWVTAWVVDGVNVYHPDASPSDYPPNALVTYAPLAIPADDPVRLWAALNVAMAVVAAYLAVRAVRPAITFSDAALPMAMFLCWGGFRTLLQFSLLSLTCGLLAMVWSNKRPVASGVALAIALAKPQIGIAFVLWSIFARRLRVVGVAAAVVVGEVAAFCVRTRANAVQVLADYTHTLRVVYSGDSDFAGLAQLRPVVASMVSNVQTTDAIAASIAGLLFAVVCVVGVIEYNRGTDRLYAAPALTGVWSLLTFYHLTYGFVLLLPLAALLRLADNVETLVFRKRLFWALQIALMADIPGLWRRTRPLIGAADWINAAVPHTDQVLMLALFACVAALAVRRPTGCNAATYHRLGSAPFLSRENALETHPTPAARSLRD
jgi:hypothetical protein